MTEQNSLREAIGKIVGTVAPYSLSWQDPASIVSGLKTTSDISNTPYDPAAITAAPAAVAAPAIATAVPAAAPAIAAPVPVWQSPYTRAVAASPAMTTAKGMSVNEYVASKLGGYDWRGKASQVGMLADEYRGGSMSSANAYIASKLGGYDWRGKAADVGRLGAEYRQLNKNPNA